MNKDAPCCPPVEDEIDDRAVEGMQADDDLARMSKALGHPARVKIIRILIRRNSCVCGDLVGEIALAQSTVSQHLKVLKEADLIRGTVEGQNVCYCVNARSLRRFRALAGSL